MNQFSRVAGMRFTVGCLFAAGLAASPAGAEESRYKAEIEFELGDIIAVESNIDEDTLREIFTAGVTQHADALADWTAQSVTLPLVTFTTRFADEYSTAVYSDLVLNDVREGLVSSISIGGVDIDYNAEAVIALDAFSARDLSMVNLLAYYGLVPAADPEAFETIYADIEMAGGHISFDGGQCVIGPASLGTFSARPLRTPFFDLMDMAATLQDVEDELTSEAAQTLVAFYGDLLTSFANTEMRFESLSCKGVGSRDRAIRFAFGPLTVGAFGPAVYPPVTLDNVELSTQEGDELSTILLGQGVFKGFDYSELLAALAEFPIDEGEAWLQANASRLIPEFRGFGGNYFSFDGFAPDTGEPMQFSLGDFDLELGAYTNGIPTSIKGHTRNLVFDLEALLDEDDDDPAAQVLRASGLEELNLGQWLDAEWDAEREVIVVRAYGVEVVGLGAVNISAEVLNATDDLFSWHDMRTMMAAMQLAVDNISVEIADEGGLELFMQIAAAEGGIGPRAVRAFVAEEAERILSDELGERAEGLIAAIGTFLREGGTLTLEAKSADGQGVGLSDLARVEDDPLFLLEKFDLKARWH